MLPHFQCSLRLGAKPNSDAARSSAYAPAGGSLLNSDRQTGSLSILVQRAYFDRNSNAPTATRGDDERPDRQLGNRSANVSGEEIVDPQGSEEELQENVSHPPFR